MPSRHKSPLVGWHPPADLAAWLRAEAERRDVPLSVVLTEACQQYRENKARVLDDVRLVSWGPVLDPPWPASE